MDYTAILIGLGIVLALVIVGKIFSILTKIVFIIILIAAIAIGIFFWYNGQNTTLENKTGYSITYPV